jgi:hypothetical protein
MRPSSASKPSSRPFSSTNKSSTTAVSLAIPTVINTTLPNQKPFLNHKINSTDTTTDMNIMYNRTDPCKVSVSDVTTALIREYLVSKGYRKTLEAFGNEETLASCFLTI